MTAVNSFAIKYDVDLTFLVNYLFQVKEVPYIQSFHCASIVSVSRFIKQLLWIYWNKVFSPQSGPNYSRSSLHRSSCNTEPDSRKILEMKVNRDWVWWCSHSRTEVSRCFWLKWKLTPSKPAIYTAGCLQISGSTLGECVRNVSSGLPQACQVQNVHLTQSPVQVSSVPIKVWKALLDIILQTSEANSFIYPSILIYCLKLHQICIPRIKLSGHLKKDISGLCIFIGESDL